MIANYDIRQLVYSMLAVVLLGSIPFQTAFAQKVKQAQKMDQKTGEIVMTVDELESLLTTIAEKRKERLARQQELNPMLPLRSSYSIQTGTTRSDDYIDQNLRLLHEKLDLLLYKSGTQTSSGPSTVQVIQPAAVASGQEQLVGTGREARRVLTGHTLYFAHNSTRLSDADRAAIQELIPLIQEYQNEILVLLRGYASQDGNAFYNNQLSFNRADAIKQVLVKQGVNPANIMILYHGADSTLPAVEARRVEIVLEVNESFRQQ